MLLDPRIKSGDDEAGKQIQNNVIFGLDPEISSRERNV
jgi:hypothetical protein